MTGSCRVCSSQSTRDLFTSGNVHGRHSLGPERFSIRSCDVCGCMFTDIDVNEAYYRAFYRDDYYEDTASGLPGMLAERIGRLLTRDRRRLIERRLKGPVPVRTLEVGCGRAEFLAALPKIRYEKHALEIHPKAVEHIKTHHPDIRLEPKDLLHMTEPRERYGLIMGWHVLEHIPQPLAFLASLRRVIQDDGLLVLSVPNAKGLGFFWTREDWFHMDTPRHLTHLGPSTLKTWLESTGWRIETIGSSIFEYPQDLAVSVWKKACRRGGPLAGALALILSSFLLVLRAFMAAAWPLRAEIITVAARPSIKPSP